MFTMPCMLCKKSGRIFNVFINYGNASHNVRDDVIEIFGIGAEPYLNSYDCVCNVCMNMLDNIAKLKRKIWPLICRTNPHLKGMKLGKVWDIFASLKIEDDSNDEDSVRTPTPNLLAFNYSREYNRPLENKIANMERHRSLSRASSGFGRSDASETSEVRNIFAKKKRRKKKGHNWSRQKRSKSARSAKSSAVSSRSFSVFSTRSLSHRRIAPSPLSDCSYASFYTIKKSPVRKRAVEYDEHGRLVKKRTRSVSRAQGMEARNLELLESTKFYCGERDCQLYFEDFDVVNHHRVMDHNILALYYCDECPQKYTTSEHLKLHQKIHDVFPFLCPLCHCEVPNQEALQEHLEGHLTYSVPCKYCDKSFLDKKKCENHIKLAHSGSRERIVHKRIILDRVDKDDGRSATRNNKKRSDEVENFIHFIPYTDMERSEGDLDVTRDNLQLMNVNIYSDEDVSTDESELLTESPSRTACSDSALSPIGSLELDM